MHIKKLEISGFKSFVDRTVIHFDHDIIGIVGPNGCGKSNIVDAIRWCMGEQSAKHLRGRSMEDVIFNGSESRPPHGLAEVTLTFDNTDPAYAQTLPEEYRDYPEIAVTRRLFRDGTSEYQLNKTQVRLRDITELFLGTGVGTKAYSVVEQGRIGQIVSARAEDRRLFIEEAAGITKYKQRRKQAERKMDATRQNLLRINDIVGEIERTRSSLKRQVAKAERFVRYRTELEDLILHDASHRLLELTVTSRIEREQMTTGMNSAAGVRGALEQVDGILEQTRAEAAEIEQQTENASKAAFEADNEVARLLADIERSRDRLRNYSERLTAAKREQESIVERMAQLTAERHTLQSRIEELGKDEEARKADAQSEDDALAVLREEEGRANQEVHELRARASEVSTQAAAAEARLDGLLQRIVEARARVEKHEAERDSHASELETLTARKHALEKSVAEAVEGKRLTLAERESLEQEFGKLKSSLLDVERAVDSTKNELSLKRNRLRALEDMHRRLEGVGAGTRALLAKQDPEVYGMVADRIEAPQELTAAFAGLLGERLQYVIVEDQQHGLALLEDLRKNERGRAHVVTARPPYVAGAQAETFDDEPGVVCRLADRLGYAADDDPLVRTLVGNAVVVESPQVALDFVNRHPGVTAVAIDGTVVRPDGVIIGGTGDGVAAAMVEQKREMHSLADTVAKLEAEFTERHAAHSGLKARLAEVETSLDRARQGVHEGELAHVALEKDLARVGGEIERSNTRLEALQREIEQLSNTASESTREEATSRAALDELRSQLEQAQQSLGKAEERASSWRERVAGQAALVTERKVRLAQVKEQMEAARTSLERVIALLEELEGRGQRLDVEAHEASVSFGETAARIVLSRDARGEAQRAAREAHLGLDESKARLDGIRQVLASRDAELKERRQELDALDEAVRKHEMSLQRMELELEHLLANVRDKFRGLDLRRVVGDYHARPAPDEEHRRRIEELTQLIDRMGPVNLDATAEYEDAEKRFVELNDQKVDVEQALLELERAIKHMNKESRRRFRETFTAVNELFSKTFTKLFRGGRAQLSLTDPEDLLNSGVDIQAQPPGKKLGNIELMSGGEKALTAVSLIFAIFQHRPSPFCILDEVDAPLDEANVARYNEAIRSMTDRSQFILITHIRKTMQSVDVLYGVTMGEPGVSRLVSVKVNDTAQSRSETRNAVRSGDEPEQNTQVA